MAITAATPDEASAAYAGPMLQLEAVHKRFGELHVLRGIDLEVKRGGVVCVIGPSGSARSPCCGA